MIGMKKIRETGCLLGLQAILITEVFIDISQQYLPCNSTLFDLSCWTSQLQVGDYYINRRIIFLLGRIF